MRHPIRDLCPQLLTLRFSGGRRYLSPVWASLALGISPPFPQNGLQKQAFPSLETPALSRERVGMLCLKDAVKPHR